MSKTGDASDKPRKKKSADKVAKKTRDAPAKADEAKPSVAEKTSAPEPTVKTGAAKIATSPPPKKVDDEAPDEDAPEDDKPMSFWEHLDELRKRLLWALGAFFVGCLVGWEYKENILEFLVIPFDESWKAEGLPGATSLHFASPGAAFTAYLKLSMIGGAVLASPMVFYQLWAFVAPGLYSREKRYVIPFVVLSTGLFIGGGLFGWRTAFPITFQYFLSMSGAVGNTVTITPTVMMAEYISFVMQLLLGFGIIFEIPLLLTFLALAGIVNYKQLIKFSRYFVFIAFVVAAVLTPPDVTSQLIMAVPMCVLYLISIGLVYIFGPKVAPAEEEAPAKAD